ncbi:MAG: ABC transporter permease subunit [Xanthomonadales bacterium]|nr:ABC transporter permease subunit [Xanthomonadales bacterium]
MFEFFRFELRQQLRSLLLWLMGALFAAMAFGAAATDAIQIGGGVGNVHRNAPMVAVQFLGIFTLIGMLFTAMAINSALLRDFEQGTAELIFASPIRRRDYVAGRILAAVIACLMVYVLIGFGIFIAQFMPWVDAERLGPVSLYPYAWTFAVIVLPNLLFTAALLSLLAILTRSILWVYIGVLGFFILLGVSTVLLRDLDNVWIATLSEPLGMRAFGRTIRYWAADQRNTQLPAIGGYLLANRALWLGIALALFVACFALFKTERSGTGRGWRKAKAMATSTPAPAASPAEAAKALPKVLPTFGASTGIAQFLRQLRFDTVGVLRGIPFIVMLAFAMANFIPGAIFSESLYGTPIHPVTSQMLQALQGAYSFVLIIIVLFYAGELVAKERSAKIHEVTDAMPVPNWVPLAAKFAALVAVIACFQLLGGLVAILIQLVKGHTQLELTVYAKTLSLNSIVFVLMGGLALCLQVFTNNKYVGYALLILVLIGQLVLGMLDFNQNLYNYAGAPDAPYSDMNGYGHFLGARLWFQGYWGLFLLVLLLLSAALWVRGVGGSPRERLRLARKRLSGPLGVATAVSLLAFLAVGGYLFWNTNIRNDYLSPDDTLDLRARYEREYKQYQHLQQPKIIATAIEVDLRPEIQTMRATGTYRVRNPYAKPITDLHISMMDDKSLVDIDMGGATLIKHDAPLGYRIYRLKSPILPGAERIITFKVEVAPNGITNDLAQTQVVDNGTFFNSRSFPTFGYSDDAEIQDRNERRKRNLGEPRRMPKLEDQAARASTYLTDDADWIDFRTTICTAPDQIALSPGYLQREFMRDGRRCFSYAMDRPMLDFYSYLSARWQVKKGRYRDIPIEVYYDAKHAYNVDRMIEAVQKSLAYYETHFTPYQHRQVRIIEFPSFKNDDKFAQSFANTIPYSESVGFIADLSDKDAVDYVFYITAHEIAHQWWAHQVIGANMQGATVLSESLAQYSALMVMEKEYGRGRMRKFLKYELDNYLSGRGGEIVEELPLYRVENQPYIHYRKASLVFYRLRDEIGEDALNRALKKFLQDKGYQQPPYTTSVELLDYIRAEAGPQHEALIADLFEKICFYDNRVESATAKKRADGKYEVVLELHAAKRYADGKGKETPGKLDDWIEVGVYAKAASGKEADEKPLYLQRHHVTAERTTLRLVVDGEPYEAGFDPDNKLIDRVPVDNRRKIDL